MAPGLRLLTPSSKHRQPACRKRMTVLSVEPSLINHIRSRYSANAAMKSSSSSSRLKTEAMIA